jgi:hypothetical protein
MWTDRSASPSRVIFPIRAGLYLAKAQGNQCIRLEAKILGLGSPKSTATSKIYKTNLSSDRNWNNDNFRARSRSMPAPSPFLVVDVLPGAEFERAWSPEPTDRPPIHDPADNGRNVPKEELPGLLIS